ncbi:MAG TPA: chitobiase/beta-hexosaminidase C-terminal domain-containing protein [Ureibacillus sp.]|nr:chitobiase/beta-hexosaminidase C-terminal domain-containing protein [Ureibacillus sp.]
MSKKRKNKYFLATLAGTVVASTVVATPNLTEAAGKSFPDVKADDYFYDAVTNLVDRGLVSGFPDGTFKPYEKLTRGQAAVILAGLLKLDTKNVTNPKFKDVPTTHSYYGAIAALANAGYIKGFEDGTYGASKPITRNHIAIILAKAFELSPSKNATLPFTDIYPDYKQYITALYENGITVGTTKTTFGGTSNVTRGQFAQFLLRAESAKSSTVSFKIENLSNTSIQTTEGKLSFDESLKSIFSTTNASALKGAEITAKVKDGKIITITALTLNAEGKENAPVVFDGGNETIAGDVTVNADYLSLKNIKVKGDIKLTSKVVNEFSSNGLISEGELIIGKASNPVASLSNLFAATNDVGPKINLTNTSLDGIEVGRDNVQLNSDKKLPEIKITATVSSIEVNADVEKVTINVSVKIEVTGTGTIDQVDLEKAVELALKVAGQVKSLVIEDKGSKVEVGVNVQINSMVVPKGSKIEEVISNYYSVRDKINDVKDEGGTTVTPPSSGGGSSGGDNSAQVKQALIKTANEKLAAIPEVDTIISENIEDAKSKVDAAQLAISAAKNAGAVDADFVGLDKVQKALDQIKKIETSFELSIMHTNDTHARDELAPKRATVIKEVRKDKPNSLLIDAGDVFSGTLYFNEFKGQASLKLMNYMGYDVMTFGNHEFDLGSSPEGHQALADFIEGAQFSFVSANVNFAQDEKFTGLFTDLISSEPENGKIYNGIVKEIDGEKVGIFGLTTEETASISSPGSIAFENYIEEAKKAVKAFEDMGVDKIIAVSHIGYDDNAAIDNDQILAKSVDGIDVIVGGHSHTQLDKPVVIKENLSGEEKDPTVIVQAYQYSDYLGMIDVTFDENGIITEHDGELIQVSGYEEDPEAAEILKPYKEKVSELNNSEIGVTLTEPLTSPRTSDPGNTAGLSVRKNETILGNLITDGMLSKAKEYDKNVVMAFTNGGGIRASINAGPITIGEIMSVLPFGNTLALMDVTGAELKEAFETSLSQYPKENGGFLHVAGAIVKYDPSKPAKTVIDGVVTEEGQRIVSISYKNEDGTYTEIKDNETYTVATNAFTAKGGDGFDSFKAAYEQGRVTDLGLSDWENFRDHLLTLKTIPAKIEGRIVDVTVAVPEPEQGVVTKDLIISEYIEGSGTNKAIEIYNGTGSSVDLSNYTLELYANSGDTGTADGGKTAATNTLKLSGTLENGKTYVLYNSTNVLITEKGNQFDNKVINFNGNDPIVLKKGDEIIDSLGQSGSALQFAKDKTLVRKSTILAGDNNVNDVFDPAVEWDIYPIDTFSYLGSHTIEGGTSTPVDPKVEAIKASTPSGSVKAGTKISLSTETEGATIYYTTDGSEPTKDSIEYSGPITVDDAVTIKAIAIKDGVKDSEIATFTYSLLQEKSIAEVRNTSINSKVMTSGVVTAVIGGTTYIQDDSAGIVLYGFNLNVEPGDKVSAVGTLTEYSTLLEINVNPEDVTVIEKVGIPAAKEIQASEINEDKEGTLVTLKNVSINNYTGGNYIATDDSGAEFQLRPSDASLLVVNKSYESITAVVSAYGGVYQLIPRNAADIIVDSTIVQTVVASPSPGLVKEGDTITLTTGTEGATIYYTVDGSTPTISSETYSGPITITEDTKIKAFAVKEGLKDSEVVEFSYKIQKGEINIHDIQGEGHYSDYVDQNVTGVDGIVTHILDANNFFMQDIDPDNNDKTSEGILVYKKGHGLKTGDVVTVDGVVKEWFIEGYSEMKTTDLPVTEINASVMTKLKENQPLPAPVVIGEDRKIPTEIIDNDGLTSFDPDEDGIDFYESLEGMLVSVNNPKVVALQKYGELTVIPGTYETNTTAGGLRITSTDYNPERITINIDDEKYLAKMGDYFTGTIAGVVSYGYGYYQVLSDKSKLPELKDGGNKPETTTITPAEDKLTIASYNVENFSTKTGNDKVEKLAKAVVENMKKPDIIGLLEVQDNDGETDSGTTDASKSAEKLIAKIKELGGPEYVYTDVAPENNQDGGAPGGNIRVGILYNPDRVKLAEGTKGTATQGTTYVDGSLTLNPGRIDPTNEAFDSSRKPLAAQFEFNGEKVIVVANHFNSKGGDLPTYGKVQPPVLGSEVQRNKIATIVNGFVQDIKAQDPDANVVLLGDFNDFEFSNPLQILKGNELVNKIEQVPELERYTYSYQGNAQVLDHILVTKNLDAATTVDILHINSGFMEAHGRASDHDPVMIQVDFTK